MDKEPPRPIWDHLADGIYLSLRPVIYLFTVLCLILIANLVLINVRLWSAHSIPVNT